MIKNKKSKLLSNVKISETFSSLKNKPSGSETKIVDLLHEFNENGIALAMILFALPVAIPLPYPPGFTTIIGIPLIILSIQMLLGYSKVILPRRINEYSVKNNTLIAISNKISSKIEIIEKYIRPRFSFAKSVYCEQVIGLISLLCSIAITIPLPLTNAIPALGIVVMILGMLNRDGIVIVLGFIISIIGLLLAIGAIIASWIGIKYILNLFL